MARRKQFGQLTERSQERIAQEGARYGLTRRQSRERYNRGTFNPLARTPERRVPKRAPYYPVESGDELKDAAMKNMDRKLGDTFEYNRFNVKDSVKYHATDTALRRMAGASEDELRTWAQYQKKYSHKGKATPEEIRSLGWSKGSQWYNPFWYHAITILILIEWILRNKP